MEVAVKLIITVLFITLVALTMVFFGIFGIAPLSRLVDKEDKGNVATTTVVTEVGKETSAVEEPQELQEDIQVFVPEASPVTQDGKVVTGEGVPVKLDVEPGSPEAPQQSNPISEAPKDSVELTMTASGISPSIFEVLSGAPIIISITSGDAQTHVFKFNDPSLSAVAVGVGPGETRAITFNAPAKGEYSFFCDVPGHSERGETGVMVVE